jgi:hypothetical protein
MFSIKGIIQDGVAQPNEPVKGREGQAVIITFLEENSISCEPMSDEDWERLDQILEEYQMDTRIGDLAYQHDHYIYGTPKKTTQ